MTINFYLPRYKSRNPMQTIFCRIQESGDELNLNTLCKIDAQFWDKDKQRANLRKAKNPLVKNSLGNINQILDAYEIKIDNTITQLRKENPFASFEELKIGITKKLNKKKVSFFSAYDDYLKLRSREIRKDYYKKLIRVKTLLQEYEAQTGNKISLNDLNTAFLKKFYNFLVFEKENKMLNNTAHKIIQLFKSFIIYLNENLDEYGLKIKISHKFKYEFKQNKIVYLTEDELMKIYNLEIKNERLQRVRDVFCFQCFTGVRYSDIERLQRVDIQGSIWNLFVKKTKQILEIPLTAYALSILAKYQDYETPLPVISNQKFNVYIKELCEFAEIDTPLKKISYQGNEAEEKIYKKFELIGSHTARRTFISLSLMKGMSADVIMSITGHSDYKMMKRYLAISNKYKKEQMYKAWAPPMSLVK